MDSFVSRLQARAHAGWHAYLVRRYKVLFYSLLVTLAAAPILAFLGGFDPVLKTLLAVNLLAAAGSDARLHRPLLVLAGLAVAAVALAGLLGKPLVADWALIFWIGVAAMVVVSALRFSMRSRKVGSEQLYAALGAYLLAGHFFGLLYWTLATVLPQAFAYSGTPIPPGGLSISQAIYFSFVTLATLGFGDFVPFHDVSRGVAVVEAIAGQLYIAVMVARLVSRHAAETD